MRPIDADELLLHKRKMSGADFGGEFWDEAVLASDIKNAPTVDAVEVVRCKDCKHHRDKNEQEQQYLAKDTLICTSQDATEDCWNAVWPDHFCSCGEREDNDRNG